MSEKIALFVCTFVIRDRGEHVSVLTVAGCESGQKVVLLNGYVDDNENYVVCNIDFHLNRPSRLATSEEKKFSEETKSVGCNGLENKIAYFPTGKFWK